MILGHPVWYHLSSCSNRLGGEVRSRWHQSRCLEYNHFLRKREIIRPVFFDSCKKFFVHFRQLTSCSFVVNKLVTTISFRDLYLKYGRFLNPLWQHEIIETQVHCCHGLTHTCLPHQLQCSLAILNIVFDRVETMCDLSWQKQMKGDVQVVSSSISWA